jgi:hypothetical protein
MHLVGFTLFSTTKAVRESRVITLLCLLDLGLEGGEGSASRPFYLLDSTAYLNPVKLERLQSMHLKKKYVFLRAYGY